MTAVPARTAGRVLVLHPGDVALAARGDRLETLLGSCVAIVLTDPRRTVAAMCHIVHSRPPLAAARDSSAYAEVALAEMFRRLASCGISGQLCEAFVYGGGNMFPGLFPASHVGAANVRWTLDALAAAGIRIVLHDLGGNTYRRLSWTVGPGVPQVTAVLVPTATA